MAAVNQRRKLLVLIMLLKVDLLHYNVAKKKQKNIKKKRKTKTFWHIEFLAL